MKTMKKIASSLFAFVLCASLLALPGAAFAASGSANSSSELPATGVVAQGQTGTYIYDERELFTPDQFETLEARAAELASKYDMGVYFLTTDYMNGLSDPTSSQRTDYATTYYKEHSLGLNPTGGKNYGDGIMFVIAADSRDYVTIAYGQGSYSFSDKGIEAMEEAVLDNIKDHRDNWYGAATTYYDQIGSQLAYYEKHGKAQEPLDWFDWAIRLFIILGIPLIVTFIIIGKWKAEMKTAIEKGEAGNYLDPGSVVVTKQNDQFLRTTHIVTPKPKDSDSGGGGGWGGGGGGGFSSSGGGKF